MNPVVQDMLMSVVRKLLVSLGTILISKGWFTEAEVAGYIPELAAQLVGLLMVLAASGWSLWNKYRASKA